MWKKIDNLISDALLMSHSRKHFFSLVEITVVIAIMAVLCSVAAVKIREGSHGSRFEQNILEFRDFLLRCRNSAREQNQKTGIYYLPAEKRCIVATLTDPSFDREDDTYWMNSPVPPKYVLEESAGDALRAKFLAGNDDGKTLSEKINWTLPDGYTLEVNTLQEDETEEKAGEKILLFTCFAGSGIAGKGVSISSGGFNTVITCAPLTGAFRIAEGGEQ